MKADSKIVQRFKDLIRRAEELKQDKVESHTDEHGITHYGECRITV